MIRLTVTGSAVAELPIIERSDCGLDASGGKADHAADWHRKS